MVLLLQLNGTLPEFEGHERRLYVWTCRRKTCRRKEGSIRALRGVQIADIPKEKKKEKAPVEAKETRSAAEPAVNIGETLFGANPSSGSASTNPFSTNTASSTSQNPFSTASAAPNNPFAAAGLPASELAAKPAQKPDSDLPKSFASALSLNSDEQPKFGPPPPPEPWPQESELPAAYPLYYLDPDYEELDKVEEVAVPTQTMDVDEGGGSSNQPEDKDVYESTIDKTFQKFADRLAQNPEQVLRYEFMGQPLLYSKYDAVGKLLASSSSRDNAKVTTSNGSGNKMPRCTNCGAGRVFEVQMTPHTIMELERDEPGLDGMEWGTIIVGVCSRDCQQKGVDTGVGYVEEWVGVQWEELKEKR
jgi:pre-rRNA-processing protein TSR4